jgi:methionyl aminopeptidase
MRNAGKFNAQLMDFLRPHVKAGIRTDELDRAIHDYTVSHGHRPATLNYKGFSKSCCISVNDVVAHGIPGDYVIKDGDIVNVDITTFVDGWIGDQCETFLIGEVSPIAKKVTQCAFDCMYLGIDAVRPGGAIEDIGYAISRAAYDRGLSVVRDLVGHGIGRNFHEEPSIPFFFPTEPRSRERIEPGMCFTIEPMINTGTHRIKIDERDGWTARTLDGGLSAQFEHSILVTDDGAEILTQTQEGPQRGHKF